MPRITESELVIPSLYFIMETPGITTTGLRKKLVVFFRPTGEDAVILNERQDTKFTQIVRNLVSHETLTKQGLATFEPSGHNRKHFITEKGVRMLFKNPDALTYFMTGDFLYDDLLDSIAKLHSRQSQIEIYSENEMVKEGAQREGKVKLYERSSKLRKYAFNYYSQKNELFCSCCGFDFYKFYGETGKDYIEMHHKKPIFKYRSEDFEAFAHEAVKNIIPVCANCHRMLHRKRDKQLTIDTLKAQIKDSHIHS